MSAPFSGEMLRFAVSGALDRLLPAQRALLLERGAAADTRVRDDVRAIIDRVRGGGDRVLLDLAERFDGVRLDSVEVPRGACERALRLLDPAVRAALEQAAAAITDFHRALLPRAIDLEVRPGVRLRRLAQPLERVGVYAPGGTAAYPSSVLMGVVPARVAGVRQVVVCSPPGPSGSPPASVLAACALAGADRVFALGGAGAVAALAFGTETVPRVDRIVGPGNAWVSEAKRQLNGQVGIDCPAGPSEILILADDSADPALLAGELIAQAEHDPAAVAILITTAGNTQLDAVRHAITVQLESQPRRATVVQSFAARGALLHTTTIDAALDFAADHAPEHLLLALRDPDAVLARVRNAGTVFMGTSSSVTFGDYITGANHVLPTAGTGRSFSGLDTLDFLRCVTVQSVTAEAARGLAGPVATLAQAEGLPGHAAAARMRAQDGSVTSQQAVARRPVAGPSGEHAEADAGETWPRGRTGSAGASFRPTYRELTAYDPGREPCAIDLSDNTNLFGVCPPVREVLDALPDDAVTRYPSVYAATLKTTLAVRHGLDAANIATGCGSDDIIDSAIRAFCEPGDVVAFPAPTFGVVPMFTRMNAAVPVSLPMVTEPGSDNAALDIDALLQTAARVIYLCRPNNPTGTSIARADVERLLDAFGGVVLIDEAYADFAEDDLLATACASGNAVVIRTLSKAFGLAGLRVGFAAGSPPVIAEIEKSRGPYKVNSVAEHAAVAALAHGRDWVASCIAEVRDNRSRLLHELRQAGYRPPASRANFLLVPLPAGAGATDVARRMRRLGVAVRPFAALPGLGECIRVTIGPWPMLESFLQALAEVAPARADGDVRAIARPERGRP